MSKRIMLLLLLSTLLLSCKIQNETSSNQKQVFLIIFGDRFVDTYVDLFINNKEVVKKGYLDSDKSDGRTDLWLSVIQKGNNYYISISGTKELILIENKTGKIDLSFVYKGIQENFRFEKNNGEFIVIGDDGRGNIYTRQTKTKPLFD